MADAEQDTHADDSFVSAEDNGLTARLALVALNLLSALATISMWSGAWAFLDGLGVPAVTAGVYAALAVLFLGTTGCHRWLELILEKCHRALQVLVVLLWTWCLALLSLLIWRLGFGIMKTYVLPPGNNPLALLLASLGFISLLAVVRFRSACECVPVATVTDNYDPGFRFVPASFSADDPNRGVLQTFAVNMLDLSLTIPVVFVWKSLWALANNFKVPHLVAFFSCSLCISGITFTRAEFHLLEALDALDDGIHVVGVLALWDLLLAVLVILTWRGLWDYACSHLPLMESPPLAMTLHFAGTIILASIRRLRSTIFPPVAFSLDGRAERRKAFSKPGIEFQSVELHDRAKS